jgi:hypothetical protein
MEPGFDWRKQGVCNKLKIFKGVTKGRYQRREIKAFDRNEM